MSIKLMTWVWDGYPGKGSDLLCMLAMADFANDEGGSLHPSVATIAKKLRVDPKQARRLIHGLIDEGFVSVVGNESGGQPGATRHYQINFARLKQLAADAETAPLDGRTPLGGRDPLYGRGALPPVGGDGSPGWEGRAPLDGSQTTIEPPRNHQGNHHIPPGPKSAPKSPPVSPKPEGPFGIPELVALGVDPQCAADWLKVRSLKKAANTVTALNGLKREAEKAGLSVAEAVEVCAVRNWQGFNASWLARSNATGNVSMPRRALRPSEMTQAERDEAYRACVYGAEQGDVLDGSSMVRVVGGGSEVSL